MAWRLSRALRLCVAAGVVCATFAAVESGCGIDAVGVAASNVTEGGAGTSSGGSSSSSSSSSSSGSTSDGGNPGCVPSGPESCEDGIDNDCNGTTDCEDPACSAFACAKSETGWTIVSVTSEVPSDAGADAGTCAVGWTNPRTMIDNPRGDTTACACTCGAPNGNPCANGTATANLRTGTTNCNDGTESINRDGACHALVNAWNGMYNGVQLPAPGSIVQVSCAATAALPPVVDDGVVVVCDLASSPPPTACTGGSCVHVPGADRICLLHPGDQAQCPSGFSSRRVIAPAYTDGRVCDACTCTTDATSCSGQKLAFYSNATCTAGQRAATADNACNSLSGSGTPSYYRYEATANGGCVAASATTSVTGALTLTDPVTLCCP